MFRNKGKSVRFAIPSTTTTTSHSDERDKDRESDVKKERNKEREKERDNERYRESEIKRPIGKSEKVNPKLTPLEDLRIRLDTLNDHYEKLNTFIFTISTASIFYTKVMEDQLQGLRSENVQLKDQLTRIESLLADLKPNPTPNNIPLPPADPLNSITSLMNFDSKQ